MSTTETKKANAPKKAMTAFFFFMIETTKKLTEKNPSLKQKEKVTKAAEVWKALTDKQKTKYNKLAEDDKLRYDNQMKQFESKGWFILADGSKSNSAANMAKANEGKSMKKKFGDDVLLPKKPSTSYLIYTAQNVNKIKEEEKI